MKTYNIYHIPTFVHKDGSIGKIGCTALTIKERAEQQGYTDVELLETHADIDIASNRERELQKQYGYKVDTNPYWLSIEKRSLMGISGGNSTKNNKSGFCGWNKEQYSNHNKKNGQRAVESGQLASVRDVSKAGKACAASENSPNKQKWLCPGPEKHISSGANYKNWCLHRGYNPNEAIKIK